MNTQNKLYIIDFDSTLCEIETIDEFVKATNIYEKISKITQQDINGELNFFISLQKRVKLLEGAPIKILENIYKKFKITKGAQKLISELKKQNYTVIIFSGGFDYVLTITKNLISFSYLSKNSSQNPKFKHITSLIY